MWARDYFTGVREAVVRHRQLEMERVWGKPRSDAQGPASGPGDPTAATAARIIDADAEMRELEHAIADALALCAGLRRCFSRKADAVELHYIGRDGCPLSFREVALEMGVHATTAKRWCDELLDWCDFVGPARAAVGQGGAEG